MPSARVKSALLVLAFLCACGARAHAQTGVGRVTSHQHDSATHGGSTLSPLVLNIANGSTETVSGLLTLPVGSTLTVAGYFKVPAASVDLSTVTSALALKFNIGPIPAADVDLSTVATALAGKQASGSYLVTGAAIPPATVDLSTVTTALALKASNTIATRQIFLSGSGTYTTPANVRQIRVRMIGGGGGGAAYITNAGTDGSDTSFNSIVASHGLGGGLQANGGGNGGSGGSGSASLRVPGGGGGSGSAMGGVGGSGAFGGAGSAPGSTTAAGRNAFANTGGGGSGACGAATGYGSGGGAGEYVELIINSPSASYSYAVGGGGAGGVPGGLAGGNGGSGVIIVDEYY